jgi:hypothetical protein
VSTSNSPLHKLQAEARRCAKHLKEMASGKTVSRAFDPAGKIAAAQAAESLTFGVVMDDKVIKITMTWVTIRETSEDGLVEYIVEQMRGGKTVVN